MILEVSEPYVYRAMGMPRPSRHRWYKVDRETVEGLQLGTEFYDGVVKSIVISADTREYFVEVVLGN